MKGSCSAYDYGDDLDVGLPFSRSMHVHSLPEGLVDVKNMVYDFEYVGVGGVFTFYDLESPSTGICVVFFKASLRVDVVA